MDAETKIAALTAEVARLTAILANSDKDLPECEKCESIWQADRLRLYCGEFLCPTCFAPHADEILCRRCGDPIPDEADQYYKRDGTWVGGGPYCLVCAGQVVREGKASRQTPPARSVEEEARRWAGHEHVEAVVASPLFDLAAGLARAQGAAVAKAHVAEMAREENEA